MFVFFAMMDLLDVLSNGSVEQTLDICGFTPSPTLAIKPTFTFSESHHHDSPA